MGDSPVLCRSISCAPAPHTVTQNRCLGSLCWAHPPGAVRLTYPRPWPGDLPARCVLWAEPCSLVAPRGSCCRAERVWKSVHSCADPGFSETTKNRLTCNHCFFKKYPSGFFKCDSDYFSTGWYRGFALKNPNIKVKILFLLTTIMGFKKPVILFHYPMEIAIGALR